MSFMQKWDFYMLVLLFFTATVTPYEVAFLQPDLDFLFFLNRSVDLGFIAVVTLYLLACQSHFVPGHDSQLFPHV